MGLGRGAAASGIQRELKNSLPFRKKALYYGLMLLLTILVLEGMARVAYYAAYGQGYGGGRAAAPLPDTAPDPPEFGVYGRVKSDAPTGATTRPPEFDPATTHIRPIRHPFYGNTNGSPEHYLNTMPPRPRREDVVVVGLLGGSVAELVEPYLQRALNRHFAANRLPRQPVVVGLALGGVKQPQQTIMVANTLLLGGEFDLIVNLDGFNELAGVVENSENEAFPFFSRVWSKWVGLTTEEHLLVGKIQLQRREQARLAAAAATSPLRRSAFFGLANRWRRERTDAAIIRLNQELAAVAADYSLEKYGPQNWPEPAELFPEAVRVWYRGSVGLARLAELAGAEYYHFLQPNQYVPGAKTLSAEELRWAYDARLVHKSTVEQGYPLLTLFNRELPRQGINYFDLTRIFVDHPETLYVDVCCHMNARGNELLAAEMVRRMAPALRRRGGAGPAAPVSALAAAENPAEPGAPPEPARRRRGGEILVEPAFALAAAWHPTGPGRRLVNSHFQVYHQEDKRRLWYIREDCAPEDAAARFFLHLTPRALTDLPPYRREHGFDNRDFSFAETGGRFWGARCQTPVTLPDYPLEYLRTGQYVADAGALWAGDYSFPE